MFAPAVDLGGIVQRYGLAVDADPDIAGGTNFVPQCAVGLARVDLPRGEDIESRADRFGHDLVDDLVSGLRPDGTVTFGAMRRAEAGEEDPQVVVDLGDGADGGTRRLRGIPLLDGDRRREAFDVFDPRLLHLADELPRIGAEALDVAALPFGVDRVHRQRTLAGPARPAQDRQLVAGDRDVDVLQVVLAGTADTDLVGRRDGAGVGRPAIVRGRRDVRSPPMTAARACRCVNFVLGGDLFGRADGNDLAARDRPLPGPGR